MNDEDDDVTVPEITDVTTSGIMHGPRMTFPRGLFDDDGRLSQEDFRAKLHDLGIVDELKRCGLWLDDDTTNGKGGIGFRDLEEFYDYDFSPVRIQSDQTLFRSGERLRKSARVIRQAVDAYRWARSLEAVAPFEYEEYFLILRSRKDEVSDIVDLDCGATERDVLAHFAKCADSLDRLAERVSVPGNKSKVHSGKFCRRWTEFALSRCNKPLDAIGCRLSEIIFGTAITEDSFSRARKRFGARKRKINTGQK